MHAGFAAQQQSAGKRVWQRPVILTLPSWLRRCLAALGEDGRLLDNTQADVLWQQVIRADLHHSSMSLLQIQASAKLAFQAHQLLGGADALSNSSGYPDSPTGYLSPEHCAFLRWRTAYLQLCKQHNWLDIAALTQLVIDAFAAKMISHPQQLILIGFDQLNNIQSKLLRQLEQNGTAVEVVQPSTSIAADLSCVACPDEQSEISAAARWARSCLESQIGKVAVVVPNLEQLHGKIERIFRHEFAQTQYPDLVPVNTFNVSLGQPLARQGMITTALTLLALEDEADFESISYLLRSPWLSGSDSDAGARANFESWLRRRNINSIKLNDLIDLCRQRGCACSSFAKILVAVRAALVARDEKTMPQWAEHFESQLSQVGWPGARALSSSDYQLLTAWQDKLLPQLAALGVVCDRVGRSSALSLLNKLAHEQLFQAQAQDSRLQVIGLLESAGLHFDALWVMGLTDRVLPGAVQHNPFLPVALQRHYQMPHCSIEHENVFAKLTLQRLLGAAPQLVLSFPCADNDRQLSPSPFVQPLLVSSSGSYKLEQSDALPSALHGVDSADWEYLADDVGAPLITAHDGSSIDNSAPAIDVSGGTNVLREQALCPFRAYVHCRLKVRALEAIQPGVDNRVRGEVLHKILEQFWLQVGSQQALCAIDDDKLYQLVRSICKQKLQQLLYGQALELLPLEVERLTKLIIDWLQQYEKNRAPFKVMELEQTKVVQLGALRFNVIPDRIDCLATGGQIIIDYKTGLVHGKDLLGERLLEPQLPIYALNANDSADSEYGEVMGVAFAQIRAGDCAFKGVASADELLSGVKSVAKSGASKRDIYSWSELLHAWQQQLERSAQDFTLAQAQVDPVNAQACQFCDLQRLCRIGGANISVEDTETNDSDGGFNG